MAAFDRGSFSEAARLLVQASQQTRDAGTLGRIQLHIGLCRAFVGQTDQADRAFTAALSFDPTVRLDADRFKPSVVARFRAVRRSCPGELVVRSTLPGVVVRLRGRPAAKTPFLAELPAGSYQLELRRPGVTVVTQRQVTVAPHTRVELVLPPNSMAITAMKTRRRWDVQPQGEIAVRSELAEAEVRLAGKVMGRAPFWGRVPAGIYRVEVIGPRGAARAHGRAVVVPGGKTEVQLDPARALQPAKPDQGRSRLMPWILAATSATVAVGAAALGVGLVARGDHADWQDILGQWEATTDPAQQRVLERALNERRDAAESKALTCNVLIGATGALAVTAVVLFVLDQVQRKADKPAELREKTTSSPTFFARPGGIAVAF